MTGLRHSETSVTAHQEMQRHIPEQRIQPYKKWRRNLGRGESMARIPSVSGSITPTTWRNEGLGCRLIWLTAPYYCARSLDHHLRPSTVLRRHVTKYATNRQGVTSDMLPSGTHHFLIFSEHIQTKSTNVRILEPEVAFQTSTSILKRTGYSNTLLSAFLITFQGLTSIQFGYVNTFLTQLQHSKISLVINNTKTCIMRTTFNSPILLFLKVLLIWNFLSKFGDELISITNKTQVSIS